jgi:ACS family hexuronate transporter-like MFS transporter
MGEATNFPACIKAIAEWFPKRQHSLATGIFNTGTNFAAMGQGGMLLLATQFSWRWVFIVIGLSGIVWLVLWLAFYREPRHHQNLGADEYELIRDGKEEGQRGAG